MKNLKSTLKNAEQAAAASEKSLSPELITSIEKETLKKTGAKLLTKEQAKSCLVSAGVVGTIFDAFDKWLEGDKKGGVLRLGCGLSAILTGVGMMGPAIGVGAATVIAAALLKKKKESALLMKGGVKCNR